MNSSHLRGTTNTFPCPCSEAALATTYEDEEINDMMHHHKSMAFEHTMRPYLKDQFWNMPKTSDCTHPTVVEYA